eukprot:scaffold9678_cov79-Cyclotella_meneghiniana.AAC.7
MPQHSQLIATMSIKQGGLGLPHPMQSAISTVIVTTKRCIQFATEGVCISDEFAPAILPQSITCLHDFVDVCTPPPRRHPTNNNHKPHEPLHLQTSINRWRDHTRKDDIPHPTTSRKLHHPSPRIRPTTPSRRHPKQTHIYGIMHNEPHTLSTLDPQ